MVMMIFLIMCITANVVALKHNFLLMLIRRTINNNNTDTDTDDNDNDKKVTIHIIKKIFVICQTAKQSTGTAVDII